MNDWTLTLNCAPTAQNLPVLGWKTAWSFKCHPKYCTTLAEAKEHDYWITVRWPTVPGATLAEKDMAAMEEWARTAHLFSLPEIWNAALEYGRTR